MMDQLLGALKGAAEATRLRIIALLGHGELTVSEVTEILGLPREKITRGSDSRLPLLERAILDAYLKKEEM